VKLHGIISLNRLKPVRIGKFMLSFRRSIGGKVALARVRGRLQSVFNVELKQLTTDLKKACGELEKAFLKTGIAVEKLAHEGGAFVQKSEKFVDCATGRSSGAQLFMDAMPVIERPLNFLSDGHAKTQLILDRLKQDNQRIDELINFQSDLQRTIGPLKYIQTLFKIESAPLGGEVQAMFGSLTREIEALHNQISELFTTRFLELRTLQMTLNQVIRELQDHTNTLHGSVSNEKAQIEKSLAQMHTELSANQSHESHIGQVSKQINGEVQKVVVSLQYQDIINQKLQHTFQGIEQLEKSIDAGENWVVVGRLCKLEAKQLQLVREELENAEKNIRSGVSAALNHLLSADKDCLTLADFNQLTTSADGMVQVMLDALATLRKEMTATVASAAKAYEQLRPMGGLASDLTFVVRDLSVRIHLIGLNAQIQAAQVGNGVALEALSARTSEISRATTQISEEVARKLDRLVVDLGEDVKSLEQLRSEVVQQQGILESEGTSIEHELHKMRDGTLALLEDIDGLIVGIRNRSEEILGDLNYTETSSSIIENLEAELLKAADEAGATGGELDAEARALLAKTHRGYTMSSERKVFSEIIKGEAPSEVAESEHAIELFEVPAAEEVKSELVLPEQGGESPVADNASNGKPAADFGSNVELF